MSALESCMHPGIRHKRSQDKAALQHGLDSLWRAEWGPDLAQECKVGPGSAREVT